MFRFAWVLALLCLNAMAQTGALSGSGQSVAGPDALFAEGQKLLTQNTPESLRAALVDFQQALAAWQQTGDEPKQVDALLAIANTQFVLHDAVSCQKTLEQAHQLVINAHDKLGEAKVASGYAVFLDAQKDETKAIEQVSHSADLFHSLNRPVEESQDLFFLSALFAKTHDQQNLIATYERVLPVAAEAKNSQMEAFVSMRLGWFSLSQPGDDAHKAALAFFERALPCYKASHDQFNLAMAWWGMGDAYDWLRQPESARDSYRHAADLALAIKDTTARGRLFKNLGHVEIQLKAWADAAQHLQQAIPLLPGVSNADRFMAEIELGTAEQALNDKVGALKSYETAAEDSHRGGVMDLEATSWLKVATLYDQSYDWQNSVDASTKAVAAARSPGGGVMLPAALESLSGGFLNAGEHHKSLAVDLEVLPLLQGNNRINILIGIGINYSWLAQYSNALKYLTQGLSESSPDSSERAGILVVLAEVHTSLNDLPAALQEAEESRDIYRQLQISGGEAKALNQLGLVYQNIGDRKKSEAALNGALANDRANSNLFGECSTLNNLGELQRYFGDFRKSEPLYQQALAVATQIGDRYRQADILANLGLVQHALGQEADALVTLQHALEIRRQLKDSNNEGKMLSDIGLVLLDNGEPQQGLEALTHSVELLQKTEDIATKASALENLGSAYYRLGVYQDAETYLRQAEDLDKKMSLDSSLALVLNNLATLELSQAVQPGASSENRSMRLRRAGELYKQALPLTQRIGDKLGQARILTNQAMLESEQGHQQQALQTLRLCQALASETGDVDSQAFAEHSIGTVYARLNDGPMALRYYHLALPLWKKIESVEGEEQTRFAMAKAERKGGNLEQALRDVRIAIDLSGRLSGRVATDENRSSLFATTSSYYELEIDILMQLAKLNPGDEYEAQAFEASESSRARSLLDLLAEAHANVRRGIDPQLLAEEKSTSHSLAAKEALRRKLAHSPESGSGQQELENEIAALSSQYDLIEAQIRNHSPAYAALTQPRPLTVKEVQTEVLDPDTVLLEYSLGHDRSYLWVLTTSALTAYELPPRLKIEDRARRLSTLIRDKELIDDEAAYLSGVLLAPAAKSLKHRIVIVADGELQQLVPFAVLPEPQSGQAESLLAHHEILIEPSASAVAILRRNGAARTTPPKLLAMIADPVFNPNDDRLQRAGIPLVADAGKSTDSAPPPLLARAADPAELDGSGSLPRLKGSGTEARTILEMGPPEEELALLGFDANKNAVLNARLSDYRIVHFATHGLANSDRPALSGLVLSLYDNGGRPIDGFLTLNDIYNLQLPVKLVVLSACESGQGQLVHGEGIVGLTRGFMYAGAASLVVSLWNVNDQSTAELMRRFYQSLLSEGGLHPAAALRTAQLSMMREKPWSQPYYWAAFTVQGDWR